MAAEAERSLTLLQARIAAHRSVLNPEVAATYPNPPGALDPAIGK
jgi:hypothetical protein